jgi:hypothetical protein
MKKVFSIAVVALMIAMAAAPGYAQQRYTYGQGGWYCPMMGQGASVNQGGGYYCSWMGGGRGHRGHSHGYGMAYCPMYGGSQGNFNQYQPSTKGQVKQQ